MTGTLSVLLLSTLALAGSSGEEEKRIRAVAKAEPSVVQIRTDKSVGSGFIIDPIGLVITNAHVVEPNEVGDTVGVMLSDQEIHLATIWARGGSETRDLALLRISSSRKDWPTLGFGSTKTLKKGQSVLALGYPRGLPFTATSGIISAVDRKQMSEFQDYLQIDASVNPGNSGGPLITLEGKVVGVNTLIISKGGGSEGLNFAVKSEDVLAALAQFRKNDVFTPSGVGMQLEPLEYNDGKFLRTQLLVAGVRAGGPADKAGVRVLDVLKEADGRPLDEKAPLREFMRIVRSRPAGESLPITVQRDGEPVALKLSLAVMAAPKGP